MARYGSRASSLTGYARKIQASGGPLAGPCSRGAPSLQRTYLRRRLVRAALLAEALREILTVQAA